jgi:hypothetical protein
MGRGGKRTSAKIRTNICAYCGNEFTFSGIGASPKYCCENCKKAADLANRGVTLVCKKCGKPFVSINPDAKYCSTKCAGESRVKEVHYRTKQKKVCPICGKDFETIKKSQICCSPECGSKQGHETLKKYFTCQYCGSLFWRENAFRMMYCSVECQKAAIRARTIECHRNDPIPIVYKRICPECGTQFDTNYSNHIYCSDTCCYSGNLRMKREQWMSAYEPSTFVCKECGTEITTICGDTHHKFCCQSCADKYERRIEHATTRHKKYLKLYKKRREQQISKAFVENVFYDDIYERDQGVCGVCGLPVLYDKSADNNWSGTIDHITPLSKDGEHSMQNCQLAHRICNSLKSDNMDFNCIDWKKKASENNYWKRKYLQGLKKMNL